MEEQRLIDLENISKQYDGVTVLDHINLYIRKKEFVTLLGPSGCGKTTTLRIIGGFETADTGRVMFDGQDISGLPAYKRRVNTVFQKYALFPHLNVQDNIAFGLKIQKLKKAEIDKKVREIAAKVDLSDEQLKKAVSQLSGGQQQRVAIARALVTNPSIICMDEPLSNLDAKLRLEMRYELQRLHVETGSTFVYVTHDQMEAMTLATQICLINNGVLQQYDAPLKVYGRPNNLFVADFVGNPSINFIEAKGSQGADGAISLTALGGLQAKFRSAEPLELGKWFADRDAAVEADAAALREAAKQKGYVEKGNKDETFKYHIAKVDEEDEALQEAPVPTNEDFVLGVRPEFIEIAPNGAIEGEIYGAMPTGMESTIKVRVGDFLLTGVVFGSTIFKIGEKIRFNISGDKVMLFDRKGGKCIALGSLEF